MGGPKSVNVQNIHKKKILNIRTQDVKRIL